MSLARNWLLQLQNIGWYARREKNKQVSLQLMQSQESRQKWLTNVQKHTTLSLQQKILRFTQFVCWQLIYSKIDVNVISLSYVRKILLSSRRPQIQEWCDHLTLETFFLLGFDSFNDICWIKLMLRKFIIMLIHFGMHI